jgi:hypothetical protein
MKRWVRPVLILTVAATVTAAGTYVAYANWIVPSKQIHIQIKSATMPRGVTPTAAIVDGNALVSWKAQEIGPGTRMQSYIVTAHSTYSSVTPNVTHTVTAAGGATESITFSYGELRGGDWYWTLVPKFQSWAGAESAKSDQLALPVESVPPIQSPPADTAAAAAKPATKGSPPIATPEQSPVMTAPSPSPSNTADSAIPVLPLPSDSSVPLPPLSTFSAIPPPPLP